MKEVKNVLGKAFQLCSVAPKTGFFRTGTCETGFRDLDSAGIIPYLQPVGQPQLISVS